jgi:signal transduction histidine kinase
MVSNYKFILLGLSVISSVLTFLPFIFGYHLTVDGHDQDDNENISHGVDAGIIGKINFGMIITSLVLLFEFLLDWKTLFLSLDYSLPRFVLVGICLITSILFYYYETLHIPFHHLLELCVCCFYSRGSLFSGCLLFQVETQTTIPKQILEVFTQFLFLLSLQLYLWRAFLPAQYGIVVLSTISAILSVFVCLSYLTRTFWIYGCQPLVDEITARIPTHIKKFRLVIASCGALYILAGFFITLAFGAKQWIHTTAHELMCYFIQDLLILILAYHLPGRMAHIDATFLQFQLQSKRAFVRYVGHEIRTPLNTVTLGLDLIQSNIASVLEKSPPNSTVVILNQISRMVAEVSDSSNIAIDILNDMLLYDKIEQGNIAIFPEKIDTNQLLISLLQNFSIQVFLSPLVSLSLNHTLIGTTITSYPLL